MSARRVLVVGGLTRLGARYRIDASNDLDVEATPGDSPSLEAKAEAADAVVLVLNHLSHAAAAKVRRVARRRGTPVASITSSSAARVRASIASLLRSA
jgi:hypothetical protein